MVATRFVSHAAVLPRAAAVVTHAGMGIVGKATYAGVPIVAVPSGATSRKSRAGSSRPAPAYACRPAG